MNFKGLIYIFTLLAFVGCFDDPKGTTSRPSLGDVKRTEEPDVTEECTIIQYVNQDGNKCYQGRCPDGTHQVVSDNERNLVIQTYNENISPDISEIEDQIRRNNFELAVDICVDGPVPARPSGEINILPDTCICQNGQALSINACTNTCAARGSEDPEPTLILNTSPSSTILNDNRFIPGGDVTVGTTNSWCNTEIEDGRTNPSCVVEVNNGSAVYDLTNNLLFEGQNTVSVEFPTALLNNSQTFLARLVEKGSGSNASSVTFQFRADPSLAQEEVAANPLIIQPMNMYTCFERFFLPPSANLSESSYLYAHRNTFFHPLDEPVRPVSDTGQLTVFCHDFQKFADADNSSYPRLESFSHIFSLWDPTDGRLTDSSPVDQILDVNKYIQDRLLADFGITDNETYFRPFLNTRYHPRSSTGRIDGYFLVAFSDGVNSDAYCPTSKDYNDENALPIMQILKEIVGVDTEGLFLSIEDEVSLLNPTDNTSQARTNFIFIRESLLKQLWFRTVTNPFTNTKENVVPVEGESLRNLSLRFYWPPNFVDPIGANNNFQKQPWQNEYFVVSPSEAQDMANEISSGGNGGNSGNNTIELPTTLETSDRRLGCVPKEN